tara:strand:+ start:892 stop:993 length:102 start_codon:yes stop_codon:yes gene_type:complete
MGELGRVVCSIDYHPHKITSKQLEMAFCLRDEK